MTETIFAACEWFPSRFIFFSQNTPPLLYYIYFSAAIPMLFIGFLVYFHDRKNKLNRLLFYVTVSFAAWLLFALAVWSLEYPSLVMFFWTLMNMSEVLVYFFTFYFFMYFIYQNDLNDYVKLFLYVLLLPAIILMPTTLGLNYFDFTDCLRNAGEGIISTYNYILEIFFVVLIFLAGIKYQITNKGGNKGQVFILMLGSLFFLLSFAFGNLLEVYFGYWEIGQYGLLGAPIFVGVIAYLIVKHKAFNIKMLQTTVMVLFIWLILLSLYFVEEVKHIRIIATISFLILLPISYRLIQSVKDEIRQKDDLLRLSLTLEKVNLRLEELDKQKSEFISIASHQLRTPLTAIRGYISLALEGSYGPIKGTPIEDIMNKMYTIDLRLSQLVEDLLNVSKIEAGKVQYKWENVALEPLVKELYEMFGVLAEKRGLALTYKAPTEALPLMVLDVNKIKEILSNLIDNSIKYTEKGGVTVSVEKDEIHARVIIADTGIGITPEDMERLFGKFIRTEATKMLDAGGSGLGLFVGKTFVEAHGGRVYAESDGPGKGAKFIVELPLVNPNARV